MGLFMGADLLVTGLELGYYLLFLRGQLVDGLVAGIPLLRGSGMAFSGKSEMTASLSE
jgi:hypothetical protein